VRGGQLSQQTCWTIYISRCLQRYVHPYRDPYGDPYVPTEMPTGIPTSKSYSVGQVRNEEGVTRGLAVYI
jgi:hypothetical protein